MQTKLIATVLAGLFTAGAAIAQLASPPAVPEDQPIVLAQAQTEQRYANFDTRFKAADTDGDGALSRAEVAAADLDRIAQHFDQIDRNHDGKISRDELRAAMRILMPALRA